MRGIPPHPSLRLTARQGPRVTPRGEVWRPAKQREAQVRLAIHGVVQFSWHSLSSFWATRLMMKGLPRRTWEGGELMRRLPAAVGDLSRHACNSWAPPRTSVITFHHNHNLAVCPKVCRCYVLASVCGEWEGDVQREHRC